MGFICLSTKYQSLIALAELIHGDVWDHVSRMMKSLFYLSEREEGNMFFMLPAVLFHSLGNEYCYNLLKSLEDYSEEAIEYILSLQQAIRAGEERNSKEYRIVHDAFLLNAESVPTVKEMHTPSGKALIKQRRSAQRLFSHKSTTELLAI